MGNFASAGMTNPLRLRVAVETPQHTGLGAPLDYLCERTVAPGTLVRVPLGKRELPGVVWSGETGGEPPAGLRPVAAVVDALPPRTSAWCALVEFAAAYYPRGIGEVALSVLQAQLRNLHNAPP